MYSYGSPHMAAQKQDDQLERTFSSYVRIQDVVLKTYLGWWTIGRSGRRGSGISVLPARYDDDDDIKARIDKTQQNSKCRLCGDGDEMTYHIISECSILVQREFKSRHDGVGKVIYWELCKKFNFDNVNRWYIHNSDSVPKNKTNKILCDFVIQTNHIISARRPNRVTVKKGVG